MDETLILQAFGLNENDLQDFLDHYDPFEVVMELPSQDGEDFATSFALLLGAAAHAKRTGVESDSIKTAIDELREAITLAMSPEGKLTKDDRELCRPYRRLLSKAPESQTAVVSQWLSAMA